ncbi:MAG: tyrosine-type recombinase/integrase [Eubacteriales bacterium]|nr:tyrosine-type recombinase/integrase [Eubacteriales bacterium]
MSKRRDDRGRILRSGESQRKDGRYMYQFTDTFGNRRTLYSSRLEKTDKYPPGCVKLEPALREKELEVQLNRRNGLAEFGGDLTVLELAEKYIATKTGVRESTKAGYRTTLSIIRKEPFGGLRIDKVKISDAKLWLIKLQQKDGRHYSSIHTIRGVLRPAFQMAVEDDLLRKNPFDFHLSDVLYDDSQKREALSPWQEREFLRFVQNDNYYRKYYDAFFVLLNTGLRISEFCGLTAQDVDYEKHCIHVTGQLVRHSNMVMAFEPPKTEAGFRDVPMSADVEACFRRIMESRQTVRIEPMIDGRSGFFFLDMNGQPTVALHWQHYFKHIVDKYNSIYKVQLPKITPHVCRHTFCSKMARKGMNPKNLQYIMGHSEIGVTMNTYTHLEFEDALEDFQKVMTEQKPAAKKRVQ